MRFCKFLTKGLPLKSIATHSIFTTPRILPSKLKVKKDENEHRYRIASFKPYVKRQDEKQSAAPAKKPFFALTHRMD
jgi:hypothetical protein